MTATAHRPHPWTYTRIDALNTLRRPDTLFFTLLLPLGMYLMWGASQDYSGIDAGRGNVAASIMTNMATFSVAITATCTAAGAAVEQAGGWGRQMALTPGGLRSYGLAKLMAALIVAISPVTVIFIAGLFTGAQLDTPLVWLATYLLALLAAIPFSCYGLAMGMWLPAQAAVGIAGASISIFAFLANLFVPLGGKLFLLGRWTPLYGAGALAVRPIQGDLVATATEAFHEPLWAPVANITVWTILFALLCLAARRRATVRL